MGLPKVNTGRGPDFAEVAEVLTVRTNQIALVYETEGDIYVLYTPFMEEDVDLDDAEQMRAFRSVLARGKDGILFQSRLPVEIEGGLTVALGLRELPEES